FYLYVYVHHPDLPSFPTRRSSDLGDLEMDAFAAMLVPVGLVERGQHGAEPRLLEPQRSQLGRHRGVEAARGMGPYPRHCFGGGDEADAGIRAGAGEVLDI